MRVISGIAKGHKLKTPEGLSTRPTTDRIKESLFNIIAPDLYNCRFLDLFSGSGGIGIEALSRGAREAIFIDSSCVCKQIILDNLYHTKLNSKGSIHQKDIIAGLEDLGKEKKQFDIIFMDPPYHANHIRVTLKEIMKNKLLAVDGYIIVERPTESEPIELEEFTILKEKVYKTTTMTFLGIQEEE